jgi:lipopolysaccharide transport system permease protein
MLFYGVWPTLAMLWLLPILFLAVITTLGVSFWLSALNVRYRDVRYAIPFLIQFWLFITPIAYPSSLLTEPWQSLYGLNPMAGVVEGFRWALLGTHLPGQLLAVSTLVSIFLLVSGLYYFRWMEKSFADIV